MKMTKSLLVGLAAVTALSVGFTGFSFANGSMSDVKWKIKTNRLAESIPNNVNDAIEAACREASVYAVNDDVNDKDVDVDDKFADDVVKDGDNSSADGDKKIRESDRGDDSEARDRDEDMNDDFVAPKDDELTYYRHRVKKGETLDELAEEYNVTKESIMQENYLDSEDDLRPGDVIDIPDERSHKRG